MRDEERSRRIAAFSGPPRLVVHVDRLDSDGLAQADDAPSTVRGDSVTGRTRSCALTGRRREECRTFSGEQAANEVVEGRGDRRDSLRDPVVSRSLPCTP